MVFYAVEYCFPNHSIARIHFSSVDKFAARFNGYVTYTFIDNQRAFFSDDNKRKGFLEELSKADIPVSNKRIFEINKAPKPQNRNWKK